MRSGKVSDRRVAESAIRPGIQFVTHSVYSADYIFFGMHFAIFFHRFFTWESIVLS